MTREKLGIHKQYLIISAPCPFKLIANNGTDYVERPSGIWQLDCYKLLPEKFMKNYPVYNLELEYDETLIEEGFNFSYYFSNLNLGDSLKGVSGDLVELSEYQFETLKRLFNVSEDYPSYKTLDLYRYSFLPSDNYEDFIFDVSLNSSKTLFFGCVIVLKDGKRIIGRVIPIFNRVENTLYSARMTLLLKYVVGEYVDSIFVKGDMMSQGVLHYGFVPLEDEERLFPENDIEYEIRFPETFDKNQVDYLEYLFLIEQ